MYPKSESPLESKYERLKGMCSGAGGGRAVYSGWQQYTAEHGGAWRYMVGVVCISVYQHTDSMAAGQHGRKEARYTNATMSILVYDIQTQYTAAIAGASQRPAACIACVCACACVILLYYYIIILL